MSAMIMHALLDLARSHHRAGRLAEAEAAYRQIVNSEPANAETLHLLGLALAGQRRPAEAIIEFRQAIALKPDYGEAVYNLARALQDNGQLSEAAETYRRAISLRPSFAPAWNNLGIILQGTHHFSDAEQAYRAALQIQPAFAEAHYNLGSVLKELNRLVESIAAYRQALSIKSDYPEALINLGNVLQRSGHLDEATAAFERAIKLSADLPMAHNSLGNALKDAGRISEAIESYRRSIATGGGAWAWDNLLYTVYFHPDYNSRRIADEHAQWNQRWVLPKSTASLTHSNDRSPQRPLKIGYVSPDLREHPVGRFMLPLLMHRDREFSQVYCYSDARFPTAITHAIRAQTDVWRHTDGMSDDQLASLIHEDQIDILVDLTMHMEGNRLMVFAKSPAPVQVTYLAYCGTTGLPAMQYRLTDPYLDPPGGDDSTYVEQSIRLPRTYWCYQGSEHAGPVGPLPARSTGKITFGCLNNYSKVSAPAWEAWFKILHALPHSVLIVQSPEGAHRQSPLKEIARQGLDPGRLKFVGRVPMADYFKLYDQIDVALDPFPYGGGTTTCDALWMGVPVISLAGDTAVSRGGLSILSNLGCPDWVARTAGQYVQKAVALASDLDQLDQTRMTLRERMMTSPLMDARGFARDVEAAYRQMWMRWCRSSVSK